MRIKVKVQLYNYALIERRKEMGYNQLDFAKAIGICTNVYGNIERLQLPYPHKTTRGKYQGEKYVKRWYITKIKWVLNKIINFTGDDFDYLFPPEYLEAIEKDLLPGDNSKTDWVIEVPINQLPQKDAPKLIADSNLFEEVSRKLLKEEIELLLGTLPHRESRVLQLHYGLGGNREHSLEDVGLKIGATRERARQLISQGLSQLRTRDIHEKLREYLIP